MSESGPSPSDLDLAAAWLCSEKYRTESLAEVNQCLLSTAGVSARCRVLEVGAGTGETTVVAARVAGPAGSVTALDRSAPMIEALTRRMRQAGLANFSALVTGIEDADLPPGTFDAAIGRYMLMLLAEPVSALATIRTSLRAGARVAMAVFAAKERNPFSSLPSDIFRRHVGLPAGEPDVPGLYRLGNPAQLARVFTDAGFGHVTVDAIESPLRDRQRLRGTRAAGRVPVHLSARSTARPTATGGRLAGGRDVPARTRRRFRRVGQHAIAYRWRTRVTSLPPVVISRDADIRHRLHHARRGN